ncbi:hypothetical protein F5Y03DRAFT_294890 [Xylaria venustula]|nr:hypothetical protein F5Y03DRAFT_294890 [Xylaria venustula]
MGSSDPPMEGMPFGYNFVDEGLTGPPSSHGNPLLDPNDSNVLGSFFTDLQTNQWLLQNLGGIDYSGQLFNQMAPDLLGHSTSFGAEARRNPFSAPEPQASPVQPRDSFTFAQTEMPPPAPPPMRQQLGQLPAYQSQPHLQLQQPRTFQNQDFFHAPVEQDAHTDAAASLTTLFSGHQNPFSSSLSNLNRSYPLHNAQPLGGFQSSFSQPQPIQSDGDPVRPRRPEKVKGVPLELQWGSDASFAPSKVFVPPQHESSEALEKKRMDTMMALKLLSNNNTDTQASSSKGNQETIIPAGSENRNRNVGVEGTLATPQKRPLKSKARAEGGNDGEKKAPGPSNTSARKRKPRLDELSNSTSAIHEPTGKRRKSAPSTAKLPRENLTDAQKRENHIKSEQKRRQAIKEGFADLSFIIPALQNGGYSKASILSQTGDWVEELINGNQALDPDENPTP